MATTADEETTTKLLQMSDRVLGTLEDEVKDSASDNDGTSTGGGNEGNFRIIDTKLDLYQLSEIDTVSRLFHCAVKITLRWRLSDKQRKEVMELKDNDEELNEYLGNVEYPELHALNGKEIEERFDTEPKVNISLINTDDGALQFCCTQELIGFWKMKQDDKELNDFPFDYEELPIFLYSKRAAFDRFKLNIHDDDAYNQETIICEPGQSQEFDCYMTEVRTYIESNRTEETYSGVLEIIIFGKRKWRYYFNEVAIFVFILSLMILPAYSIEVRDVADRLAHLVTLCLAQTALLYVVAGSLPKLSYFTILDEYLLWNFTLTLGCSIQASAMSIIEDDDTAAEVDQYCLYGVFFAFAAINIFYACNSCYTARRNFKHKFTKWRQYDRRHDDYNFDADGFTQGSHEDYDGCATPCVYHSHDWSDLGEYRDWRKKNEKFDYNKHHILDKAVVLFNESDVEVFRRQNEAHTITHGGKH